MANETQTATGSCEAHGTVQATREIPRLQFPFFVYAILRWRAQRRPFECPHCGAKLTTT